MKVHCTQCRQPLAHHCTSPCTWLACLSAACPVRYYDTDRGLIQYTSGLVESWGQQPASSEAPTIEVEDGGPAAPDA